MKLERAQHLLDRAESTARTAGLAMALAVVDASGVPVATRTMDGATRIAATTVVAKARTAVHFARPTHEVLESALVNPVVYQSFLEVSDQGLVYSMGGIPIFDREQIVGAIAASGGTGAEDVQIASAALAGEGNA